MQRILLTTLIAATLIAGYLFLSNEKLTDKPSVAIKQPATVNIPARNHINRLTEGSDQAISIEKADNFVTAEQLLSLPAQSNQGLEITSENPQAPSDKKSHDGSETYAVSSHLPTISAPAKITSDVDSALTKITPENQIKLQELLDNPEKSKESVFFIHAVNDHDKEGLWGIIQHGLIKTFTEGLTLPGLDKAVTANIPQDADEKLANKRSSFLGQILKNKVDKTYIYNYKEGILGDDPNLIKPGQQLIIVTFTKQELMGIYDHFTSR